MKRICLFRWLNGDQRVLICAALAAMVVFLAAIPVFAIGPEPYLVYDCPQCSANPKNIFEYNGGILYSADTNGKNAELWTSQGTAATTNLVKDIYAGIDRGSSPRSFININGTVFFSAYDATGTELWKTDGTLNGTTQITDFLPGEFYLCGTWPNLSFSCPEGLNPIYLTNLNDTLFFSGGTSMERSLWKSNGTAGGTEVVMDSIQPGELVNLNGVLLFTASDGVNGYELWKSDGTSIGTVMVTDINPLGSSSPRSLTDVNGTLYFTADDGAHGVELWKSNGNSGGTALVMDINPAGSSAPSGLVNINGVLFFAADDGSSGIELWKRDGTTTVRVKDIQPGATGASPANLTKAGSALFFIADDGTNGLELWKSNGLDAGTVLVRNINPGGSSSISNLTDVNGMLYFVANDGTNGNELWRSDGTSDGTYMVADLCPGTCSSDPNNLKYTSLGLFFAANDGTYGNELFLLKDFTAPSTSAAPVGGTYATTQQVALNCNDGAGAGCRTTYYTTDGSAPTVESDVYTPGLPLTMDATTTLKFFSVDDAGNREAIRTEYYTIGCGGNCTLSIAAKKGSSGSGTVISNPAGINFPGDKTQSYTQGTSVELTATADGNSYFKAWSGACTGEVNTCTVTMDSAKTVYVEFASLAYFTGSPKTGGAPLYVYFDNQSVATYDQSAWQFGDGGTSTLHDPTHLYVDEGSYIVILTASGRFGFSDTYTRLNYINVTACAMQVRLRNTAYGSVFVAYGDALDSDYIDTLGITYTEAPVFDVGTNPNLSPVTLRGGFDCMYSTNNGTFSTFAGPVIFSGGPVAVENIIVE